MDKTALKSKLKRALPSLLLLIAVALLVGLAFLPAARSNASARVNADPVDPEALRALSCARAHIESEDFTTKLSGKIKARVFGIPYTQEVYGGREVRGGDFTDTAESVSAFVKAAVRRERRGGEYTVKKGEYKNKRFKYGAARTLSGGEYIAAYGQPSVGLVRYETENAVIGAEKIGENTYRYILEPRRATAYSRNEVRTTLEDKKYPVYSSVEFTMTVDGERAVKVVSRESFTVEKFGGASCSAVYTEVFSYGD